MIKVSPMNKYLYILLTPFFFTLCHANNVKWSTRIMIDADQAGAFYQKDATDSTNPKTSTELASLKSSLKYTFNQSFDSKFQLDISRPANDDHETKIEWKDVYLRWHPTGHLKTQVGQFKEPLGHDRLLGSGDRMTIEASMATSAFTPGRSLGAGVQLQDQTKTISVGIFDIQDDDINHGYALTTRTTTSMFHSTKSPVHLGVGYSYRSMPNNLFQIKERGEVNTADNIIRSPRFYADTQQIANFELGTVLNRFWLMSEFFTTQIHQEDGSEWLFSGFYLQVSASLFGDAGKFKHGIFKPAKHRSNDIEWVIRYSGISLKDNNLGSEASSTLFGLNYYFKKQTSFMLNIITPNISGNVVNTNQTGEAISLRFKHIF